MSSKAFTNSELYLAGLIGKAIWLDKEGNKVKHYCDVVIDACLPFMNLLDDC